MTTTHSEPFTGPLRDPDSGERICELCRQPLPKPNARSDTKTCGSKCRQQLYRNGISEAREAHRAETNAAWAKERKRRDLYNANRRKKRNAAKPRRSTKT